ncbi:NADH-quinone oxidoreductase subunit H [Termitidicoccus mucosus]|uniref:complex I subunit 1 family protein n=1 Tax=Termitidicoccus mucosus TaxID=1184151 RepID=UPI0031837AD2
MARPTAALHLPEGESEIIAGHLTEYSGFKYALFFMGEYFGIIGLCGLGVTLFLGGWQAPCEFLQFIPSYLWFGLKLIALILFFIWIRATLLRLRIDQLTASRGNSLSRSASSTSAWPPSGCSPRRGTAPSCWPSAGRSASRSFSSPTCSSVAASAPASAPATTATLLN